MEDKEQLSQEPIVDTENGAETAPETEEAPLSEIDQMKADLADQKDKYLRLMAEFENFKRSEQIKSSELLDFFYDKLIKLIISTLLILVISYFIKIEIIWCFIMTGIEIDFVFVNQSCRITGVFIFDNWVVDR